MHMEDQGELVVDLTSEKLRRSPGQMSDNREEGKDGQGQRERNRNHKACFDGDPVSASVTRNVPTNESTIRTVTW